LAPELDRLPSSHPSLVHRDESTAAGTHFPCTQVVSGAHEMSLQTARIVTKTRKFWWGMYRSERRATMHPWYAGG
jgi:hypothetical protein